MVAVTDFTPHVNISHAKKWIQLTQAGVASVPVCIETVEKKKNSSTCLNLAEDTVASLKSFHWDPRELIFREIFKGNQWPHIQLIAITTTDELVCKLNIPLPLVDSTYLLTCQIVLRSRAIRWSFCLIPFHYCSHGNHPGEFYHKEPNTSKSQPIISAERHKTLSASILHSGNKMKYS